MNEVSSSSRDRNNNCDDWRWTDDVDCGRLKDRVIHPRTETAHETTHHMHPTPTRTTTTLQKSKAKRHPKQRGSNRWPTTTVLLLYALVLRTSPGSWIPISSLLAIQRLRGTHSPKTCRQLSHCVQVTKERRKLHRQIFQSQPNNFSSRCSGKYADRHER